MRLVQQKDCELQELTKVANELTDGKKPEISSKDTPKSIQEKINKAEAKMALAKKKYKFHSIVRAQISSHHVACL